MMKRTLLNGLKMTLILVVAFSVSLLIQSLFDTRALIPALFVLAIYCVSLLTDGYTYGIVAAMASVLMVNYAFTFPYFKFNFTIPENIVSAVIMIAVTLVTSALSSRVKAQESVRLESERERMRANLLRAVSHDLRTPLTTICGASAAILENYDSFSDEQKQQMISGIREDAEWLNAMVENLLSITRIDSGAMRIIMTPVALDDLLDAVLVRFRKRFPRQEVELQSPEELLLIPMDPTLIEQVLLNLLQNAVEHAVGMTRLTLRAERIADAVRFTVEDDGCGIERDRLRLLFTGQIPADASTADSSRHNTGIGLSVCESIIRAHGGKISAENRPQGGAAFWFTLKLADEALTE